jgi:hypothetical protein
VPGWPGGEGFGERGSVRRSLGTPLEACLSPGVSVWFVSRVRLGPRTVPKLTSDSMIPDPGSVKGGDKLAAGLLVPEQLALLAAKKPRGGDVRCSGFVDMPCLGVAVRLAGGYKCGSDGG